MNSNNNWQREWHKFRVYHQKMANVDIKRIYLIKEWCEETFEAGLWSYEVSGVAAIYYFKDKENASVFALKWGNYLK